MNKPLVTIVTAVYNLIEHNRSETFRQTVDSVKNQTYENIEHLIIDGASNDGTVELIESLGLKYISEPDKGIYDAFNKGIMNASGKYICFMNSDDYFSNLDAVKLSVEALEKSGADFSFATERLIDENDKFLHNFVPKYYSFLTKMPFGHQTMFTKTEVLKNEGLFDLQYKSASDYDMIIRLILKKYKSVRVKANISTFRLSGISCTDVRTSQLEQVRIFKNLYFKFINDDNIYTYIAMLHYNYYPFRLLVKSGIRNPIFYLLNLINKLKVVIKFSFKLFPPGRWFKLEYFMLFGIWIKPQRELEEFNRFIEDNI